MRRLPALLSLVCACGQSASPAGRGDASAPLDSSVTPDACATVHYCYDGPMGTENVGACRAGETFCDADGWRACVAEVLPSKELCNAYDDDCDGHVDSGVLDGCGHCVGPDQSFD